MSENADSWVANDNGFFASFASSALFSLNDFASFSSSKTIKSSPAFAAPLTPKISTYNIIYEVLDYIKQRMSGLLTPDIQETIIGTAKILEIFKVSGAGKVAGCKITEGEITSTSDVRLIRDGAIIFTGKVGTIFREKNQVKQVTNGQECGITIKDYIDIQKDDTIEAFNVTSKERSI